MNKTKIEWTDYTWNPIKGLCPVGCCYCYARKMYKRFKWDEELSITRFYPASQLIEMKPSKIFVCSTIELFHPKIKRLWRDMIFNVIEKNPQHAFQILTKLPQNIDREMPDNVWLGVSITANKPEDLIRANGLIKVKAKIKFISYEPLLLQALQGVPNIDWIIIGRLTGYGNKYNPKKEWIESLVLSYRNIPIFLKDNLREIWGEPLIQEFPK